MKLKKKILIYKKILKIITVNIRYILLKIKY